MSFLDSSGGCPNCKSMQIKEIKSQERLHEETEAMKDRQRLHYWQPETYNPQSWESQLGKALTPQQVLSLIQKWIPGAKMFPQINPTLRKWLMAFYIPHQPTAEERTFLSQTELKNGLKFICCGELKMMPEWDVLPVDDERMPLAPMRGWRSVLAIFYRSGLIPLFPEDGRRLAWHVIKQSPFRRQNG